MFKRDIVINLQQWADKPDRKPLVLRGARQVGKTTAVAQFSENFDRYLYFNLERTEDRRPFEEFSNIEELVQAIFFLKNEKRSGGSALLFIDEIQEVPEVLSLLRYFYEDVPELHVIAAGSLLETLFDKDITFPVGRVEYLVMRPVSFPEFLNALGEEQALEQLLTVPIADFAHEKLLRLFHTYALIGGMPEAVEHYIANKDLTALTSIYESLIVAYTDDVEKYARNTTMVQVIRHAIRSSFIEAGSRIKFHGFGKSNYGSREMGEALRTLEKAMVLNLVYPTTAVTPPMQPDLKKSPRLQFLDTGLVNHFSGLQAEILGTADLNDAAQGRIVEHVVGQELLSSEHNALHQLNFWIREKKDATAELDYLIQFNNKLVPLEVKSGASGRLRSLHQFMDRAPHDIALRLHAGTFKMDTVKTIAGKEFRLVSLPYYCGSQISAYLKSDLLFS